jgi:hypothetical protein
VTAVEVDRVYAFPGLAPCSLFKVVSAGAAVDSSIIRIVSVL